MATFAKGRDISDVTDSNTGVRLWILPNVTMKRMKQSITVVLALWLIASSASANLRANSEIIEDSYGTIVERHPRDDGKVSIVYTKGQYLYIVTFVNSRSVSESFSRA